MALPEDWNVVDWRPSVVLLPEVTEGIRTQPLNRDKFPEHGRAYFMMATRDETGPLVYYNAAEVGSAGNLTSQFVFWHEMGHFHLGHIPGVPAAGNIFPIHTTNRETDADRYAFNHWIGKRNQHGVEVIEAVIGYLRGMGDAPGDAEHPAPGTRALLLETYLEFHPWKVVLYNDNTTDPAFVRGFLMDSFKMDRVSADNFMRRVEREGSGQITSRGRFDMRRTDVQLHAFDIAFNAKLKGHNDLRFSVLPR